MDRAKVSKTDPQAWLNQTELYGDLGENALFRDRSYRFNLIWLDGLKAAIQAYLKSRWIMKAVTFIARNEQFFRASGPSPAAGKFVVRSRSAGFATSIMNSQREIVTSGLPPFAVS